MPPEADRTPLQRALALAELSIGLSDPNPRVGCVIVGAGWCAEGHTQAAGQAHAEVMALRAAHAAGHDPRGSTVYVTLEPCAHHGRTPPCCDALVEAGVGRVVVAVGDPNPQVAGRGLARLRAAGIAVEVVGGELARTARELNIGFFSRMRRGRPWVRLKAAASLDGRTALANGVSQWLTGEVARADGHAWRRRAGAVLTGVGTVLADDPRLDVRHVPTARQPLRVVVDAPLHTPPSARLLAPPGEVLIYHATPAANATEAADAAARANALRERGAELVGLPDARGKVDLALMLADLGRRGINELHVEAGHKLNASLLATGQVDELLVYLAPRLVGAGHGIAALGPFERLTDTLALRWHAVERVGDDLRLLARLPAARLPGDPADDPTG